MKHHIPLGQHFLKTPAPVKIMIREAKKEGPVATVLEIGPGRGILTLALAKEFKRVLAVEKDSHLAYFLKEKLREGGFKNCEVIIGDILKADFLKIIGRNSYAVVANIPYYLTSRLTRRLLEAQHQPEYVILMIQKEVAERIVAGPEDMSILAAAVRAYGKPSIVAEVPKESFAPKPKVGSAIIKITDISKGFFGKNRITEEGFFAILKAGFSQKRKYISNTLTRYFGSKALAEAKIKKAGLLPTLRPQELSIEDWARLANI